MPLKAFELVKKFIQGRNASAGVAFVEYQGVEYGPAAFGTMGFFPGAAPVTENTIFDLASLTRSCFSPTHRGQDSYWKILSRCCNHGD